MDNRTQDLRMRADRTSQIGIISSIIETHAALSTTASVLELEGAEHLTFVHEQLQAMGETIATWGEIFLQHLETFEKQFCSVEAELRRIRVRYEMGKEASRRENGQQRENTGESRHQASSPEQAGLRMAAVEEEPDTGNERTPLVATPQARRSRRVSIQRAWGQFTRLARLNVSTIGLI